MANPDFVDEGVTDQGGNAQTTAAMPTAAWAAGQIALWIIATDGAVPTLSTPNGYVLATDPAGNVASVTTNGGVAGAAECGMFVFWKRLVGTNQTSDPAPVIAAASVWGGTVFCSELNTYSGCRATGTPFHQIATSVLGAASTAVTSPAVTPTLNACTVVTAVASSNDDTAFNAWAFSGAAAPAGILDSGWHNSTGNACSFTGGRGGYATAGGARTGTTTFAASTKQARISMVLASLNEVIDEDAGLSGGGRPGQLVPAPVFQATPSGDELPPQAATIVDDDTSGVFVRQPEVWANAVGTQPDELAQATTTDATIGGASDQQRSFNASPATGTLTTPAPVAAWVGSHAYVVDPTAGGINRVSNGGNLYQCSSPGTSASSGGPTGTGTAITDGGVTWYFVGQVQGTSTAAGSQIIATVMRGDQSITPGGAIDPTDNDGGSYTAITNNAYLTFVNSFAGVWRRTAASNLKTNFTLSAQWGGSSGAGDELSLAWIEVQGVTVGAPHASSHVERASPSGGTVTAAAITTTKRCLILSFWFGNGTVQAAGAPDTAAPAGGLTLIAGASAPLSLTANGYIQHMVAWRIANPGTFAEVWTSTTNEGAQLVTIALEDTGAIAIDDGTEPATMGRPAPTLAWITPAGLAVLAQLAQDEAMSPAAITTDDDAPVRLVIGPPPWLARAVSGEDEMPGAVLDDDAGIGAVPMQAPWLARAFGTDDEIVLSQLVDDGAIALMPQPQSWGIARIASDDDLAIAPAAIDDEVAPVAPMPPIWSAARAPMAADDDLPAAPLAQLDDEIALIPFAPAQPRWVQPVSLDGGDDLPSAPAPTMIDDQASMAPALAQLAWLSVPRPPDAEEFPAAAVLLEDEPAWNTATLQTAGWCAIPRQYDADDLPEPSQLEEPGWTFGTGWTVANLQPMPPDAEDLPIAGPPAAIIDEDASRPLVPWPLAWRLRATMLDDDIGGIATGPVTDHVRITGVSPDPEVYDGRVPGNEIYDGRVPGSVIL